MQIVIDFLKKIQLNIWQQLVLMVNLKFGPSSSNWEMAVSFISALQMIRVFIRRLKNSLLLNYVHPARISHGSG